MRKFLFALLFLAEFPVGLYAQESPITARPQDFWTYSPELSEEDLYDYNRLLYMSKEDWELFRHDPRYNNDRIIQLYNDNKGKIEFPALGQIKMLTDECNCWQEPDNTYTTENPMNWSNCGGGGPGVDCWMGPIALPFSFCFYGQNFNQVYFTTKGTIAFGNGYIDWTPSEFPNPVNPADPQYDHICGFWADFDFRQSGEFKYKVTSNALYVNYINVGHWSNHVDKTNTFQMILTANGSDVLPNGKNVQFCYKDMQWAHGDIGGNGGFAGPTPANVGADRVAGNSHIQFGRFNLPNSNYNGPYGQNNNQQDGVNWLDNKVFEFSACNVNANQPPLSTVSVPCDTVFLCLGDVYSLGMQFLSPENGQVTSIQYSQSGTGLTASATSGNTATLNATFSAGANNLGANTVTITATDNGNPAASTTLSYIIFVQNVQAPPISISGNLTMCAGGETMLTASPGFDDYSWSSGCDTQECIADHGGTYSVTGSLSGCLSSASVSIDASAYFIPALVGNNDPIVICPGTTAQICTVEQWASYSWDVYPGYPGSIPSGSPTNQQCLNVSGNTEGHYRVTVEDENGCQGFNIQLVEIIESFIDESNNDNIGAYCNGLEPVTFTDGYSNPSSGNITVYLLSSSAFGWQGSYLNSTVTHPDNTTNQYTVTANNTFTIANVPITVNDQICINYVSSGIGDANNTVWIFNCSNQGQTIIGPGLTPGQIWCATSACTAQPLAGTWTVNGPPGWTLSHANQYNTVFTPIQYGLYNVCFNDPACSINHCYELEFTQAPSLTMNPGNDVLLCNNETSAISLSITDLAGSGEIVWNGSGVVPSANGLSAVAGPYSDYISTTVTASITNGCGTASDSFLLDHQPLVPQPVLNNEYICNDGYIVLDPVPSGQDNPHLEYDWTPNATGSTYEVTQSGTYSVFVYNDCDESEEATSVVMLIPPATLGFVPGNYILECNETSVDLSVGVPFGYSILWADGSMVPDINVTESGNYCYEVTDNVGCNTLVSGCSDVVISSTPVTTSGNASTLLLCPGECETLDLNSGTATSYNWSTTCENYTLVSNEGSIQVCSDQVPQDCLDQSITIEGTASNVCGSVTASWTVQANACTLKIPNVFTPNGDETNEFFFIEGLENYPGSKLMVFNRWGGEVYSSDNYLNNWGPGDLSEGTYFYTLELPFGVKKKADGYFSVLK